MLSLKTVGDYLYSDGRERCVYRGLLARVWGEDKQEEQRTPVDSQRLKESRM